MPANSEHVQLNASHDKRRVTMASTTERDKWYRVYPNPMPPGHHIAYRWDDMVLEVWPEKDDVPAPSTPHGEQGGNVSTPDDFAGLSDKDLDTAGAELGLKFPKKASRAMKEAAIANKRRELESTLSL